MLLSIIVVNFRTKEQTIICVSSVYQLYEKQFLDNGFELIIVDNNSQDSSLEFLTSRIKGFKNVRIVESQENGGFGKGNNLGASLSKGDYLLFLNSDTKVNKSGFMQMIHIFKQYPNAGIVGGLMKNYNDFPQQSASHFYSLFYVLLLLLGIERIFGVNNPKTFQKVDWVKGGFFMIKKQLFEKLRGFDEHIFMYVEDMELCFRANALGFTVYFYPSAFVLHANQGSSNRTFAIKHIYQGISYFYKKHYPHWQQIMLQFILKAKAYILIIVGRLSNNSYLIETYEEALRVI